MSKNVKIFIGLTLLISWIATAILFLNGKLHDYVIVIMLFPALFALVVRTNSETSFSGMFFNQDKLGFKQVLKALIFAIVFPIIIVGMCAFTGAMIYGVSVGTEFFKILFNPSMLIYIVPRSFLSLSIIFSLGEEYGWRGYLLPELMKGMSKFKAIIIVGIVWALYHFPVLLLLNIDKLGMMEAVRIALIQATAAFAFSFSFAQCYLISNTLYPVVVMHTFWNMYNPAILGSIYNSTPGILLQNAPVEIVNGEGVLGIIYAGLFALLMIYMRNEGKDYHRYY